MWSDLWHEITNVAHVFARNEPYCNFTSVDRLRAIWSLDLNVRLADDDNWWLGTRCRIASRIGTG